MNPFFISMVWSQVFCTGFFSESFFPNTFFYFQNFLGTSFLSIFAFSSPSVPFTTSPFTSCFLFPHIGGHHIIFTSPFSQSISGLLSQTSFSHISINSLTILTVSIATESPCKNLSINASHVPRQSILAKILGRSSGNYYGTIY